MLDVDSTLIQQEVIELLADHAGVMPEVKGITDRAMAGELDFSQSLLHRVKLLRGVPEAVFEQVLVKLELTPGALELIEATHAAGGRVAAVSGGFSQILEPLAKNIGLDFWRANNLEVRDGKLTGEVLGEVIDAEAKAKALRQWKLECDFEVSRTVAIGDGANDIQMLQAADFAVAFRPKPILRQYADLVIEENSLLPVIGALNLRSS